MNLLLNVQENTATVTISWSYTPPADWVVEYEWRVENLAGTILAIDTVQTPTGSHTIDRLTMDVEYRACGANIRVSPSPSYADRCERFMVPAKAPFVPLVVRSNLTDLPDSIPHDPSFEVADGTIWLEFTPDDLNGQQGLWSKDFNGYENGGHLSIWLVADTVHYRLQSDSVSYEHWGTGTVAAELNQVGVKFGADGFRGWLNAQPMFSDAYTGGLVGNQNAIVLGAQSQGSDPWTNALRGTLNSAEFYEGDYDFTDRWGEPPLPPIEPPDSLSLEIEVATARSWTEGDTTFFQVTLAPLYGAQGARLFSFYMDGTWIINADADGYDNAQGGEQRWSCTDQDRLVWNEICNFIVDPYATFLAKTVNSPPFITEVQVYTDEVVPWVVDYWGDREEIASWVHLWDAPSELTLHIFGQADLMVNDSVQMYAYWIEPGWPLYTCEDGVMYSVWPDAHHLKNVEVIGACTDAQAEETYLASGD